MEADKDDAEQELRLIRMSLQSMKDQICQEIDAMADRIDRVLPHEDGSRSQRLKTLPRRTGRITWMGRYNNRIDQAVTPLLDGVPIGIFIEAGSGIDKLKVNGRHRHIC